MQESEYYPSDMSKTRLRLLRSSDMHLHKVGLLKDHAWNSIRLFGFAKQAHFIDINEGNSQPFTLPFFSKSKRCQLLLADISQLKLELEKMGHTMKKPRSFAELDECLCSIASAKKRGFPTLLEGIDHEVKGKLEFILGQKEKVDEMQAQVDFMIEQQVVLERARTVIFGVR